MTRVYKEKSEKESEFKPIFPPPPPKIVKSTISSQLMAEKKSGGFVFKPPLTTNYDVIVFSKPEVDFRYTTSSQLETFFIAQLMKNAEIRGATRHIYDKRFPSYGPKYKFYIYFRYR